MIDDATSESAAAAPKGAPQPKKPRARKATAASEPKKPRARGKKEGVKRPKAAAGSQKKEAAAKQNAEKLSSEKDENPSPRKSPRKPTRDLKAAEKNRSQKDAEFSPNAAEPARVLAPEKRSSPNSPEISPISAEPKAGLKKKSASKRKSAPKKEATEGATEPQIAASTIEDPIGDVSDGEAWTYTGELPQTEAENEAEAYRAGVAADAVDGTLEAAEADNQNQFNAGPPQTGAETAKDREGPGGFRPPAKLERLQKILSQAGIASRRRAEEMIVAGRVAVNGQVVTALGSKADPHLDHIRVDGKLLKGAERHRYFLLNKPKAYVTTVSDPQGRPTVMDLVSRLGERVYPVGRLDFQSEGLLLMTNDGALANQLTRASSGVEKTYLVKTAGQPDEESLERLRSGVMIERGGPSSSGLYGLGGRVRTAPARIRQIRPGENPWYEVVLTEGRNREIRKMFSAIGHYVEKIRRVGYGPLMLDVEPGKLRELTLEEVDLLRKAAEGKLKPRRLRTEAMLPKDAGPAAEPRRQKSGNWRSSAGHAANTRPGAPYGKSRPERDRGNEFRGRREDFRAQGNESRAPVKEFRGRRDDSRKRVEQSRGRGNQFSNRKPEFRGRSQQESGSGGRPRRDFRSESRAWQPRPREERPPRGRSTASPIASSRSPEPPAPTSSFNAERRSFGRSGESRFRKPQTGKPQFGKPRFGRPQTGKPQSGRRQSSKPEGREFRDRSNRPDARRRTDTAQTRSEGRGTGAKRRPQT